MNNIVYKYRIVKLTPRQSRHEEELTSVEKKVAAAPYDAPSSSVSRTSATKVGSGADQDSSAVQSANPFASVDLKTFAPTGVGNGSTDAIGSPNRKPRSPGNSEGSPMKDSLSILIPSPSAPTSAPAYFPSPKAPQEATISSKVAAVTSKQPSKTAATASSSSTRPDGLPQPAPSTTSSSTPYSLTNPNTIPSTIGGVVTQSPNNAKSPKYNPFGSVSPKTNPFMSIEKPRDHFWEGKEAMARIAAAEAANTSSAALAATKKNNVIINSKVDSINIVASDNTNKSNPISANKGEKSDTLSKLTSVQSPTPTHDAFSAAITSTGIASSNHKAITTTNPFLSTSSGLSLGFGNTSNIGKAGVFGTGSAGSSSGGLLGKHTPSAMFGGTSILGGLTAATSGVFGTSNGATATTSTDSSIQNSSSEKTKINAADTDSAIADNTTLTVDNDDDPEEDHSPAVYGKTYNLLGGPIITGEEDEKIILQVRAKLYRLVTIGLSKSNSDDSNNGDESKSDKETSAKDQLSKDNSKETKEWSEVGLGPLRVLQAKVTNKDDSNSITTTRVVMRREEKKGGGGTKLLLNLPIRSHCTATKNGETTFVLSTVVPVVTTDTAAGIHKESEQQQIINEVEAQSYLIKCKLVTETEQLMNIVKTAIEANTKHTPK
jgi:hypothetical protein